MIDFIGGRVIHPSSIIKTKLYREDIKRLREEWPGEVAWVPLEPRGWKHWCIPLFVGFTTTRREQPERCPTCAKLGLFHLLGVLTILAGQVQHDG